MKINQKWYCSDFCARVASEWVLKATPVRTALSITAGHIEASGQSSVAVRLSEFATSETRSDDEMRKKKSTGKTQKSAQPSTLNDTETRELEIQKPSETVTMQTDSGLTRLAPSVERVTNLDGETLDAMSLIDDSVRHMHGLTKSVVENVKDRAMMDHRIGSIDHRLVKSATLCAREFSQLMKLKLAFHKEITKGGKK